MRLQETMSELFELTLSNMKRLNNVTKMCEAINSHSDTALVKVTSEGVYIRLTDFESFCSSEIRIPSKVFQYYHMATEQWSGKILLDHLTTELRRLTRMKQTVTFHVEASQPDILKARSVHHNMAVKSTNHRPRVFWKASVQDFIAADPEYGHFRILNAELQKIINVQCVMSGNHGGVARLLIAPVEQTNQTKVVFSLFGDCGASAEINILTHEKSAVVPVHRRPSKPIEVMYFLSYLKRSQNLFTAGNDLTHMYVSSKGILIKTESKDVQDPLTAFVLISNIAPVDLDSYV